MCDYCSNFENTSFRKWKAQPLTEAPAWYGIIPTLEPLPVGRTVRDLMQNNIKKNSEMSQKKAERIIEQFENGSRNGEEWAHDVCLRRGTPKYEDCLAILNEAFRIKSVQREVFPIPADSHQSLLQRKRSRR
jgi:hypothetical protein